MFEPYDAFSISGVVNPSTGRRYELDPLRRSSYPIGKFQTRELFERMAYRYGGKPQLSKDAWVDAALKIGRNLISIQEMKEVSMMGGIITYFDINEEELIDSAILLYEDAYAIVPRTRKYPTVNTRTLPKYISAIQNMKEELQGVVILNTQTLYYHLYTATSGIANVSRKMLDYIDIVLIPEWDDSNTIIDAIREVTRQYHQQGLYPFVRHIIPNFHIREYADVYEEQLKFYLLQQYPIVTAQHYAVINANAERILRRIRPEALTEGEGKALNERIWNALVDTNLLLWNYHDEEEFIASFERERDKKNQKPKMS
jgi:hypothetical protein